MLNYCKMRRTSSPRDDGDRLSMLAMLYELCIVPPLLITHSSFLTIYSTALYKLCAAPSLRTTHYALLFLIPSHWSLATGYFPQISFDKKLFHGAFCFGNPHLAFFIQPAGEAATSTEGKGFTGATLAHGFFDELSYLPYFFRVSPCRDGP